ncbi:MAG: hypothetical protein LBJ73_01750 [Rickettsiales bacterium]|jgi:hypothetical protein|nr:hypothetical protein [Rickettsiales bacterium]
MDITFLKEEQIWGSNALDVIKEYGTKTNLTDLAIVLGGYMGSNTMTSDGLRSGSLWSSSDNGYTYVRTVFANGDKSRSDPNKR